jgi:diguanylate cyclase (GGDEF)-like protein
MNVEQLQQALARETLARKAAESLLIERSESLYQLRRKLELALWASKEWVWLWDQESKIFTFTRYDQYGQSSNIMFSENDISQRIHPDDIKKVFSTTTEHNGRQNVDLDFRYRHRDDWIWIRCQGHSIHDVGQGQSAIITGTARNISEYKSQAQKIEDFAKYDTLTGLLNRRAFEEPLNAMLSKHERCCILFIDLDGFKILNDTMGHAFGDAFLLNMSITLKNTLPASSLVSRYGGDEFVCAFPFTQADEWEKTVRDLILAKTALPEGHHQLNLPVSASIGVALSPQHSIDARRLIEMADTAMDEAKCLGKDASFTYNHSLFESKHRELNLISELRNAISQDEIEFHLQSKHNANNVLKGAEILCRWHSKSFGHVSPDVFIPLALKHNLLHDITLLAAQSAASFQQTLQSNGINIHISINVSALDLLNKNFLHHLKNYCDERKVPYGTLELEVTENVFLHDIEEVSQALSQIKKEGFRLSLDDFGTGYSSLSYISRYAFDVIKIDRAFVHGMLDNVADKLLVESVVSICKVMKIGMVAEGVETREQMKFLKKRKVDLFQGYYFSKPVPFHEFIKAYVNDDCC